MNSDSDADVSRRRFLRGAAGAGGAAIASQQVAAQEDGEGGGEEQPDWGGYLDGVDGGYQDARGNSEVTVTVGADGNGGPNAFDPAGLWVDPGTTVRWEWTGNGQHNVNAQEGPASFQSDIVQEAGVNFEFEFTEDHAGITKYQCDPHASLGMLGAVAVGDDVSTVSTGGGGGEGAAAGGPQLPDGAKALGVASAGALATTLALGYLFVKYGGATAVEE